MHADRSGFADSSKPWRMLLAGCGGLWAGLTLPLTATAFGSSQWVWVFDHPAYVAARQWASNPYEVFGALAAFAFLAIGIALYPDLRRAGWAGSVMAWLIIVGAPITALSYMNASERAPLHFIWGGEFFVLVAIGLSGIGAALTAGRRWRIGLRILIGMTLVVLALGTAVFGYWPHGSLVFLAVEAIVIIAAAPRHVTVALGPSTAPEAPSSPH
jgi:hypothetical protein